jgi:hypothetical protein
MSSSNEEMQSTVRRAEKSFREAFERLKRGKPERLAKGTPVSQNNIAKEAGCDPSALRKSRYPSLVAEIQRWVEDNSTDQPPSPRQTLLAQRSRNRSLRDKLEVLKAQRDHALSLLVEADAKILDLTIENTRLQALTAPSNVTPIRDSDASS